VILSLNCAVDVRLCKLYMLRFVLFHHLSAHFGTAEVSEIFFVLILVLYTALAGLHCTVLLDLNISQHIH